MHSSDLASFVLTITRGAMGDVDTRTSEASAALDLALAGPARAQLGLPALSRVTCVRRTTAGSIAWQLWLDDKLVLDTAVHPAFKDLQNPSAADSLSRREASGTACTSNDTDVGEGGKPGLLTLCESVEARVLSVALWRLCIDPTQVCLDGLERLGATLNPSTRRARTAHFFSSAYDAQFCSLPPALASLQLRSLTDSRPAASRPLQPLARVYAPAPAHCVPTDGGAGQPQSSKWLRVGPDGQGSGAGYVLALRSRMDSAVHHGSVERISLPRIIPTRMFFILLFFLCARAHTH